MKIHLSIPHFLLYFQISGVTCFTIFSTENPNSRFQLGSSSRLPSHSDDDEFWRDLQSAKVEKMGMPISPKEEDAQRSENDFLAAMKQVEEDFQQAKEELGVDGAIDMLKHQWDQEDQQERPKDTNDEDDMVGEFE